MGMGISRIAAVQLDQRMHRLEQQEHGSCVGRCGCANTDRDPALVVGIQREPSRGRVVPKGAENETL